MIKQGFYLTKEIPEKWWFMAYYDIKTNKDLEEVFGVLLATRMGWDKAADVKADLSKANSGYTFTDFDSGSTIICVAHATDYDELFNTINHEISHATDHLCEFFGYDTKGEKSAYINGEISKQMYKGVALSICPKCNCGKPHKRFY